MSYAERVGESKLSVLRDGVRFLLAIRDAALLYQPSRIFGVVATLCILVGMLLGSYPVEFYVRNHRLEEWMIYRLLLCGLLLTSSATLIGAGLLSDQILSLVYRRRTRSFLHGLLSRLASPTQMLWAAGVATAVSVALVWPGLVEYAQSGHVSLHWSRPVAAVFLLQCALFATIYVSLQKVIDLWKEQLQYGSRESQRERVR